MSVYTIVAKCQYYENYNVDANGFGEVPHWKPKGGYTFKFPIDSDTLFYSDDEVITEAIKEMVAKENTIVEKFELVEWEYESDNYHTIEGIESVIERMNEVAYRKAILN